MSNTNWKPPIYVLGALIGIVIGILSAYLYARTVDEKQPTHLPPGRPTTGDLFKLTLSVIALVRSISDLGAKKVKG
jgi:hypothetical protein